MTDKKHVLHPPKGFNREKNIILDISQEYFSPVHESFAENVHFYSPIEYSSPKTPKNELPNPNTFETPVKVLDENENGDSSNDSNPTIPISKVNLAPPKYHNNVSPAIEKLMQIMLPNSSTPKNSRTSTKRIFSPSYWPAGQANEDLATPRRKRLDASFCSPKALAAVCQEHSVKATMVKEIEPSSIEPQIAQTLSRCQERGDSFPDDERADSPDCEVKRVALIHIGCSTTRN